MSTSAHVRKSPYDPKEYRVISLENGIKALLIWNPRARDRATPTNQNDSVDHVTSDEDDEDGGDSHMTSDDDDECDDSHVTSDDDHVTNGYDGGIKKRRTAPRRSENVSDKSACAVCVGTGSFLDPPDIPGLAHLLEHMVFMGNEKYPEENAFDVFASKNGGSSNASTDYERTVFEFDIVPYKFKEALNRFAEFFASPLLRASSLDREIEAVDNEFSQSVQCDFDRMQQILCSIANPDHPMSKFVWGNTESLKKHPGKAGIDVCERLKEFYKTFYSSHYMTVAVIACDPLDTLEEWVRASFSSVPHNSLPLPSFKNLPPAFNETDFNRLYKIVPVKDTHEVQLSWILPCLFDQYRVKPLHYLGWLLGHEGERGVLSLLKQKNFATALTAGNSGLGYEYNSCFSLFACSITLTDEGFGNVFECITMVLQYLKMLREVGPQEWIYKEIQTIEENEFTFQEEQEPIDYVESLCESMQMFEEEDYLTGDDLMFEFDPKVIANLQNSLIPERANITLLSKKLSRTCKKREKWFGTKYSAEDIPQEWKEKWKSLDLNPDLSLPAPNKFIATDFQLKHSDTHTQYPTLIYENETAKLWYKADNDFKQPRAWIGVVFESDLHTKNALGGVMADLFANLFKNTVMQTAYPASVAQLEYNLRWSHNGLVITLYGLNHKLPVLFDELMSHLANFFVTSSQFKTAQEEVERHYSNYVLKPKKLCKVVRLKVLERVNWSVMEKREKLKDASLQAFNEFVSEFRESTCVETLVQGNITAEEAKGLTSVLCRNLKFAPTSGHGKARKQSQPQSVCLPSNTHVLYQVKNKDTHSPITVAADYYQCCQRTVRDTVTANLLTDYMSEPCFDILRTQKQLGYEAYCLCHMTHGVVGVSVNVHTQGSKFSVEDASKCLDEFVEEIQEMLDEWSDEDFKSRVSAMVQDLQRPDLTLDEEAERNWAEVLSRYYQFNRVKLEIKALQALTKPEVVEWFKDYFISGSKSFKKLSVQVISCRGKGAEASYPYPHGGSSVDPPAHSKVTLTDAKALEEFRRSLACYPPVHTVAALHTPVPPCS